MSIYCQQCGTENEDGAKFCKSCGTSLSIEPKQIVDSEKLINQNTTMQTVKKVALWIGLVIGAFIALIVMINFISAKKEDSKIRELRNSCANNDAQACYNLGISDYYGSGVFNSEKSTDYNENQEALAKGCQLGHKDACYAGKYYERGCELQDGKSCYKYAEKIIELQSINGAIACGQNGDSEECRIARENNQNDVLHYKKLACQYGYSQGCIENQ